MADPHTAAPMAEGEGEFRWTAWFQRSPQPLFVLSRRLQILFVNRAWEALTGFRLADVRKRVCRRQRDAVAGSCEAILHALRPPREALAGKAVNARRLVMAPATGPRWWDVSWWPVPGPEGVGGLLGQIEPAETSAAVGPQALPEKLMALRQRHTSAHRLQQLVSELPALRLIAEQVRLGSRTGAAVLLVGEQGTGKQWLARTLHHESAGRENTFFALDCQHLPASALAWVLFGPPALAQRPAATLYLQEPGALPREIQDRLCELATQAAEDGRGPRLLGGSSTDPVAEGRLLPELHRWLGSLTIRLPPLRERRADLPVLVRAFLERIGSGAEQPIGSLSVEAWEVLHAHAWPGNLRELFSVLADACARARGDRIEIGDLAWYLRSPVPLPERTLSLDKLLEEVERRLIQTALAAAKGNKSRAADLLSIWRPRLLRRMEALGIG
jgi:DNA-binding NtrC family response regulator